MTRMAVSLGVCSLLAALTSCGPMTAPMAPRLDNETQLKVDAGWEKALSPVGRLGHQPLLDVFIGTGAYQRGVDKLAFRSEKRYSGGLVVMEVYFDRLAPAADRFEVKVLDSGGKLLRQERYGREEVEKTYHELFATVPPPPTDGEKEPPELVEQRAKQASRWGEIEQLFPEFTQRR